MKNFSNLFKRSHERSFEPGVNYDPSSIDKVIGPEGEQFFFVKMTPLVNLYEDMVSGLEMSWISSLTLLV